MILVGCGFNHSSGLLWCENLNGVVNDFDLLVSAEGIFTYPILLEAVVEELMIDLLAVVLGLSGLHIAGAVCQS